MTMSFLRKFSLMTKLITLSLVIVAILGFGTWASMNQISGAFNERLLTTFEFLADILGDNISSQFHQHYNEVQIIAGSEAVQTLNPKLISAELDSFVENFAVHDLVIVVDKNGRFIAANSKDSTNKAVHIGELAKINYSTTPWFKAVMAGETTDDKTKNMTGTFFEDLNDDELAKTAFLESRVTTGFSTAIKNSKGEILGVLTSRANEKWVGDVMKELMNSMIEKNFSESEITLINRDGLVLYEVAFDSAEKIKNSQFAINLVEKQNRAAISALGGNFGAEFIGDSRRGVDMVAGFAYINNDKWISDIGWSVIVKDIKSDALKQVRSSMSNFYVLLGMVVFIAFAFSLFFALVLTKAFTAVTNTISQDAHQIERAAEKIASQSTELSSASTEQASALEETVAVVHEINSMVEKNAESAGRSKTVSQQSREAAQNGRKIVDQMMEAISEIDQANREITSQMNQSTRELGDITRLITDIGGKTRIINEIVFQTKLLSFNASVEAARAGEYGKGFSVVAEEVGNLAQMSGAAAKEIAQMLEESVRKVEMIVNESKTRVERLTALAGERVETGSLTANKCNEALEEILKNVQSVDLMVTEIAAASQEQSTGIREISRAVSQMESTTKQNSMIAQSSSVAAEQLKTQSQSLTQVIGELSAQVHGRSKNSKTSAVEVTSMGHHLAKRKKSAELKSMKVVAFKKAAGSSDIPPSHDSRFDGE
jgi:methyl-accepting chemotaxis protein